jgi:ribulose-5-phosphate 4-epimerase/fuculose-1-phosphate aldolase
MTDSEKPIDELIALGNFFYRQNWVLGTSGNFSTILSRDPFKLLMTGSGIHKGNMGRESFVVIDQQGNVLSGKQKQQFTSRSSLNPGPAQSFTPIPSGQLFCLRFMGPQEGSSCAVLKC